MVFTFSTYSKPMILNSVGDATEMQRQIVELLLERIFSFLYFSLYLYIYILGYIVIFVLKHAITSDNHTASENLKNDIKLTPILRTSWGTDEAAAIRQFVCSSMIIHDSHIFRKLTIFFLCNLDTGNIVGLIYIYIYITIY